MQTQPSYRAVEWALLLLIATICTATLTFPLCWSLLAAYRARISRGMRARRAANTGTEVLPRRVEALIAKPVGAVQAQPPSGAYSEVGIRTPPVPGSDRLGTGSQLSSRARTQVRRAQVAYLVTCAGFGVTNAAMSGAVGFLHWWDLLPRAVLLMWVAIPIAASVGVQSLRSRAGMIAAWLAAASALAIVCRDWLSALVLVGLVLPQSIVLALTSSWRFRGASWFVAPSVFAIVLVAGASLFAIVLVAGTFLAPGSPYLTSWVGVVDAVGAFVASVAILLIIAALLALMAWLYQRKRVSDQGLLFRQWWVVCGLLVALADGVLAAAAGNEERYFYFAFVPPVATAFLLASLTLRPLRVEAQKYEPRRLLLLRTFGHPGRSTRLVRDLTTWWRWVGDVELISARDLAGETLEPPEFLGFLRGRIDDRFVRDDADLQHRLANLDLRPDGDGRFRINEFLCRDDTWKMTVNALAGQADVILIDLRAFSTANKGVRHELDLLVATVPLRKVVGLIDDTTDLQLLHFCLAEAAAPAQLGAPIANSQALSLTLLSVGSNSRAKDAARVFDAVAAAASP